MMAALKYAVVIANIRQKNQPLVVPKPYRNNRACGVDCTRLPNFPPQGLEMRASRARWRPARCTRSCKLLQFVFFYLFSNLCARHTLTGVLLWESDLDWTQFLFQCLCSSIFSRTIFCTIDLAWSSFNLDSKKTKKKLKKISFFYSKRPPSPAKTEVLYEKNCLFLLKKTSQPRKKLNFCMIKNDKKSAKKGTKKSTYLLKGFFFKVLDENPKVVLNMGILKKNPDPQLYQTFKPIRKFFCTFLLI